MADDKTVVIEKAQQNMTPATSGDEDALLLAELIHGNGISRKDAEYRLLKPGADAGEPYSVADRDGNVGYQPAADGEATDERGRRVRSVRQHIAACTEHEAACWAQAEKEGIRRDVRDALADVQQRWLEGVKRRAGAGENGAG